MHGQGSTSIASPKCLLMKNEESDLLLESKSVLVQFV